MEQPSDQATPEEIALARRYCGDEIQVDDNAVVSRCDDGVWVQAWIFVPSTAE